MTDRTLPWGDPADANYFTGEGGSDPPDDNFVVAETAAGLKLMEWDSSASEWVIRGDVNASGQDMSVGSLDSTSVSTEQLNTNIKFAGEYDGADENARLDNALSAANEDDIIVLESETYSADRTIATCYSFIGTATPFSTSGISGQWTFDAAVRLRNLDFRSAAAVNGSLSQLRGVGVAGSTTITVNADRCLLTQIGGAGTVEFATGTADGSISVVDGKLTVTDNGSNTTPPDN